MKYNDKITRNIVSNHQNKVDNYEYTSTRTLKRFWERKIIAFRNRLIQKNKYWFDSLTENQKIYVINNKYDTIDELKKIYPGSLTYQREMKLNDILI